MGIPHFDNIVVSHLSLISARFVNHRAVNPRRCRSNGDWAKIGNAGSVDLVLSSLFRSAGSPTVRGHVGAVIRSMRQWHHKDLIACAANQVRARWCKQEGAVTADGTIVS